MRQVFNRLPSKLTGKGFF